MLRTIARPPDRSLNGSGCRPPRPPGDQAGARLLRRGYSFVEGSDRLGRLDAGLYFLACSAAIPRKQLVPVQQRLSGKHNEAMNEYITHVASGLYAITPGVRRGGFWGERLLA